MLLKSYRLEITNSKCQPGNMGVHCIAWLDQDISEALPYLNTVLGGFEYLIDPPAVTFRVHGKLIAVHGDKIAVNALKDRPEAEKIIEWLKREVNAVWDDRNSVTPSFKGASRPSIVDIIRHLPNKPGCGLCKSPTCMVFATRLAEGAFLPEACPELDTSAKEALSAYLASFQIG